MDCSKRVARVAALTVALGVGTSIISWPAVAVADPARGPSASQGPAGAPGKPGVRNPSLARVVRGASGAQAATPPLVGILAFVRREPGKPGVRNPSLARVVRGATGAQAPTPPLVGILAFVRREVRLTPLNSVVR